VIPSGSQNGDNGIYVGGVVAVDGIGSAIYFSPETASALYHQFIIWGTLEITNGASVNVEYEGVLPQASRTFEIGGSGGTVLVDASTLFVDISGGPGSSSLEVGVDGRGTLNVVNGGVARSGQLLSVGAGGTLNITSGGIVSDVEGIVSKIGNDAAVVTVDGAGSTWGNGSLSVGGILTVSNGGTVTTFNPAAVSATGEIRGNGNVIGNVQNAGLVSPGTSPGALNIDGDYTQTADGKLLIELASASSYDQLLVTGGATLAGTLTVKLLDGFIPGLGQSFTILTADDVDGTFGAEVLPALPNPNVAFDVIYNAQSVVLTVLSALPGDYNGDGTVDAADYVVWRKVDSTPADYDIWRSHFGQTAGSGASAGYADSTVPEPTGWLMLFFGIATMFDRRRALVS
jgi:hypothetical protein